MTDERDEIRARIDIVSLVGSEIPLKRAGKTWKGLCPFHPDKNPSFTVSPETGRYKCWSCGEAGDIFTWEMKRRNVDFHEAIQTLAKQAGITLKRSGPGVPASVRQQQESAMEEAQAFFVEQFAKSTTAKEYCERRSLDEPTLKKWEIGYAPDVGEALAVHLKKKGFQLAECKSLFLVDTDSAGGFYDKFRGRLMIPIRDEKGSLVAFGGRVIGDAHPKYINSSDTPLYRKSRVLYGMHVARDSISKLRQAVLVEGYLDVIACHRAGVTNAVASLGTSLSDEHAKLLSRWCEEVVILYDSDDAGRKAADRALVMLKAENVKVRIALMPPGDDPDTLLKAGGPAAVKDSVDQALGPIAYKLGILKRLLPYDSEEFWNEATAILAESANRSELDRHTAELAPHYPWQRNPSRAEAQLRTAALALRKSKGSDRAKQSFATEHHSLKRQLSSAEIVLLRAAMDEKHRSDAWPSLADPSLFETTTGERIAEALSAAFGGEAPIGKLADWLHKVDPEELRQTLSDVSLDFRSENLSEEKLIDSVKRLKDSRERRRLEEMKRAGVDPLERLKLLKSLKPDPRDVQKESDRLF